MKFHSHGLDHEGDQHLAHQSLAGEYEHMEFSKMHSLKDLSHADHHDEMVSEIDTSQNALLKSLVGKVPTLVFLVTVLSLLLFVFIREINFRYLRNDVVTYWAHHFSPPLRAPPL